MGLLKVATTRLLVATPLTGGLLPIGDVLVTTGRTTDATGGVPSMGSRPPPPPPPQPTRKATTRTVNPLAGELMRLSILFIYFFQRVAAGHRASSWTLELI
jgi:hypothetical protein